MSTLTEAHNIFKVLDKENNGYITVDTFITSFHDFFRNHKDDESDHENTLKSLICRMQPDADGKILFDNFLLVFQQIQPDQSTDIKSHRYSQYSLKRFLSAESYEDESVDELDRPDSDPTKHDKPDICIIANHTRNGSDGETRSNQSDNRLNHGNHFVSRFPEFDDITNHSTWPKRKLRYVSSCKNLNDSPLLMPSAASRVRDLFSAGASPRGSSDIHSVAFSQDIGNNFDVLQMQMKRLEQKLNSFNSNQFELDEKQSQRMREENKSLLQRINTLEDCLRDTEESIRSRHQQEKKEFKQRLIRAEEEKHRELESVQNRMFQLEAESAELSLEIRQCRDESEKKRVEKHALTERLTESDVQNGALQAEFDRLLQQSKTDVEQLKLEKRKYERMMIEFDYKYQQSNDDPHNRIHTMNKLSQRHKEAEDLLEKLRSENKELSDQIEDAHRELETRSSRDGVDAMSSSSNLSKELDHCSKEELMDILARDKDSNFRLRDYIEKIIVKVMEKRPSILEVVGSKK